MVKMDKLNKAPAKRVLERSSEPTHFYNYSRDEKERLEASIQAKHGEGLDDKERRFLALKNEAILSEHEDDQPRYGH